jgi:hypothetical protein
MANLGQTIMVALLSLVPVFIASAAIADTLTDEYIAGLIRDDFESRRACYLHQGKCRLPKERSEESLKDLSKGICPRGGDAPLTLTLPATRGYSDTGNVAHYCPERSTYWVLHTQGAFIGSVSYWFGPFPIGELSSSDEPSPHPPDHSPGGGVKVIVGKVMPQPKMLPAPSYEYEVEVTQVKMPPAPHDEVRRWLVYLIEDLKAAPVANPPARIYECRYKGQAVYYVPPKCCDIPSVLFDASGVAICALGGGLTGKGDGKCPDFSEAVETCSLYWKDERP